MRFSLASSLAPSFGAPAGDRPAPAEPEEKEGARADRFRLGVLAGVGAPGLLSLGFTSRISRYAGVGANFNFIPEVEVALYGEARLSYQQYEVNGRIYPAGGGFFFGAGLGYMRVQGSVTRSFDIPAVSGVTGAQLLEFSQQGSVRSLVLTPQLGYMAELGAGFVLEFSLGAQIPVAASDVELSTSVPAQVRTYASQMVLEAENQVRSTLKKIGQQPLPTLNVRLGWLFLQAEGAGQRDRPLRQRGRNLLRRGHARPVAPDAAPLARAPAELLCPVFPYSLAPAAGRGGGPGVPAGSSV
ncbi:MAG: hypothetical protein MUF64_28955 [Polyangiaceae bacterium]|nr:hypothetical protein [Polyangiaceae bacterium]